MTVLLIRAGRNENGSSVETQRGNGRHVALFRRLAKMHTDARYNRNAGETWASVQVEDLSWFEHYQDGRLVPERSKALVDNKAPRVL